MVRSCMPFISVQILDRSRANLLAKVKRVSRPNLLSSARHCDDEPRGQFFLPLVRIQISFSRPSRLVAMQSDTAFRSPALDPGKVERKGERRRKGLARSLARMFYAFRSLALLPV